jgi:hypothetical protein
VTKPGVVLVERGSGGVIVLGGGFGTAERFGCRSLERAEKWDDGFLRAGMRSLAKRYQQDHGGNDSGGRVAKGSNTRGQAGDTGADDAFDNVKDFVGNGRVAW